MFPSNHNKPSFSLRFLTFQQFCVFKIQDRKLYRCIVSHNYYYYRGRPFWREKRGTCPRGESYGESIVL